MRRRDVVGGWQGVRGDLDALREGAGQRGEGAEEEEEDAVAGGHVGEVFFFFCRAEGVLWAGWLRSRKEIREREREE